MSRTGQPLRASGGVGGSGHVRRMTPPRPPAATISQPSARSHRASKGLHATTCRHRRCYLEELRPSSPQPVRVTKTRVLPGKQDRDRARIVAIVPNHLPKLVIGLRVEFGLQSEPSKPRVGVAWLSFRALQTARCGIAGNALSDLNPDLLMRSRLRVLTGQSYR